MASNKLEQELRRGSAELLILALLEERQRHGYEIGQLIAQRSDGTINFHVTSLYPTLYRLEDRGPIEGGWVGGQGRRGRPYYKLVGPSCRPPAAARSRASAASGTTSSPRSTASPRSARHKPGTARHE